MLLCRILSGDKILENDMIWSSNRRSSPFCYMKTKCKY